MDKIPLGNLNTNPSKYFENCIIDIPLKADMGKNNRINLLRQEISKFGDNVTRDSANKKGVLISQSVDKQNIILSPEYCEYNKNAQERKIPFAEPANLSEIRPLNPDEYNTVCESIEYIGDVAAKTGDKEILERYNALKSDLKNGKIILELNPKESETFAITANPESGVPLNGDIHIFNLLSQFISDKNNSEDLLNNSPAAKSPENKARIMRDIADTKIKIASYLLHESVHTTQGVYDERSEDSAYNSQLNFLSKCLSLPENNSSRIDLKDFESDFKMYGWKGPR